MIKLVETFSVTKNTSQELPLTEGTITEKDTGKLLQTKKKFRVDISRFTKNLNERVYPKPLWEKVINDQKQIWEGSFALADHPENEGSFKDVMGVWSNLHINEKTDTVKADITFVGPYGAKALEILEAGGKIGFSSSGFGDLKEDGMTVDENTYQIERIADCVLNPSQQVFGTIQDAIEENTDKKTENVLKEQKPMATNKYSKLEERKFKEMITSDIASIHSSSKPLEEKIKDLTDLLGYFDESSPKDLKESVEVEIVNLNKEVFEATKVVSELKETFGTASPTEFKEGLSKLAINSSLYERQAEDWKKLAESLQTKIVEMTKTIEELPTQESFDEVTAQNKKYKEFYSKKVNDLKGIINKKESNLDENAIIYKQMIKELNLSKKDNAKLKLELTSVKKDISTIISENKTLKEYANTIKTKYENKIEELTALPLVKPRQTRSEMFEGFNESKEITSYYNDLVKQYGDKITPYKERILGCKSLFEAMRIHTTALVEMSESVRPAITNDYNERKAFTEASTGFKIARDTTKLKMPKGWD